MANESGRKLSAKGIGVVNIDTLKQSIAYLLIASAVVLCGCVTTHSIQHASAQFNRHHYSEAYSEFKSIAENGGPADSELDLAYLYALGIGVNVDVSAAKNWCQKAETTDPANAELMLADIAEWVEHDTADALQHYKQAATLGNRYAFVDLAYVYDRGLGVPVDKAAAIAWLQKLVDEKQPPPAEFLAKASDMISDSQTYPPGTDMMRRYGRVIVSFHYVTGGQASNVKISRSFGSLSNDLMALQSTYMAKLPEPPKWAIAKGVTEYSYALNVEMGQMKSGTTPQTANEVLGSIMGSLH